MSLAATYGTSVIGQTDSMVHVKPVSDTEYDFVVGARTLRIDEMDARIIEELIESSLVQANGLPIADLAARLEVDVAEMTRAFDALLVKLDKFTIANNGGTGSVFYEDSIHSSDLIITQQGRHRFDLALAELIGPTPHISEEKLHSIGFMPRWFRPQ